VLDVVEVSALVLDADVEDEVVLPPIGPTANDELDEVEKEELVDESDVDDNNELDDDDDDVVLPPIGFTEKLPLEVVDKEDVDVLAETDVVVVVPWIGLSMARGDDVVVETDDVLVVVLC
jgi:hypothetical protein